MLYGCASTSSISKNSQFAENNNDTIPETTHNSDADSSTAPQIFKSKRVQFKIPTSWKLAPTRPNPPEQEEYFLSKNDGSAAVLIMVARIDERMSLSMEMRRFSIYVSSGLAQSFIPKDCNCDSGVNGPVADEWFGRQGQLYEADVSEKAEPSATPESNFDMEEQVKRGRKILDMRTFGQDDSGTGRRLLIAAFLPKGSQSDIEEIVKSIKILTTQ